MLNQKSDDLSIFKHILLNQNICLPIYMFLEFSFGVVKVERFEIALIIALQFQSTNVEISTLTDHTWKILEKWNIERNCIMVLFQLACCYYRLLVIRFVWVNGFMFHLLACKRPQRGLLDTVACITSIRIVVNKFLLCLILQLVPQMVVFEHDFQLLKCLTGYPTR